MRALRIKGVKEKVGLGQTRIEYMVRHGTFPQPIKIGQRAKAWLEDEIDEWLRQRVAERNAAND